MAPKKSKLPKKQVKQATVQVRVNQDDLNLLRSNDINVAEVVRQALTRAVKDLN